MITYGFKKNLSPLLRCLIALALGVILLVWGKSFFKTVIIIVAAILAVAGIVRIVMGALKKNAEKKPLIVNGAIDIAIAILTLICATAFTDALIVILGVAILVFAVYHIVVVLSVAKYAGKKTFYWLVPLIVSFLAAITMILYKSEIVGYVAGATLVIYAITEIASMINVKKAIKAREAAKAPAAEEPAVVEEQPAAAEEQPAEETPAEEEK